MYVCLRKKTCNFEKQVAYIYIYIHMITYISCRYTYTVIILLTDTSATFPFSVSCSVPFVALSWNQILAIGKCGKTTGCFDLV